jgi:2-polyprenyl-6-methoxyphenol hydroxylase-like FAD-dependent oxidoreductase
MVLALVLARAGVEVLVLEKHADFLRDFRGDTLHPSTLEVVHELGLLDGLLRLPHRRVHEIRAQVGDTVLPVADFSRLPVRCPFIALMPQWDFLDFLARSAADHPAFALRLRTAVTGLVEADGRVAGVRALGPEGPLEVRADLVVAADGRDSATAAAAGIPLREHGAPIDVLWFRLSRRPGDPEGALGRFDRGQILVLLDRGDYWQCGYVIAKGSRGDLERAGLEAFRARLRGIAPALADRASEVARWEDVRLLTVRVASAARWHRPGLLVIGDAAHAMSPVGGVGINLAIQDAIAAANRLAGPLRARRATDADLAAVQRRREWPARLTQRMQVLAQDRIIRPMLAESGPLRPPRALRLLARVPALRRLTGRLIGLGVRPEHVAPALRAAAPRG